MDPDAFEITKTFVAHLGSRVHGQRGTQISFAGVKESRARAVRKIAARYQHRVAPVIAEPLFEVGRTHTHADVAGPRVRTRPLPTDETASPTTAPAKCPASPAAPSCGVHPRECNICYMYQTTRDLPSPPQRTWELISDLERWDSMLPTVQRIERLDTGPIGTGSRFRVSQPGLLTAVYSILEWSPDRGFTWESRTPGVRTMASHWISERQDGSQLTLGLEWSGPLAGMVRRLLGSKARRMVDSEADTFAALSSSND